MRRDVRRVRIGYALFLSQQRKRRDRGVPCVADGSLKPLDNPHDICY